MVDRTGHGTVWPTVTAFSRAAKWYTRAGGPATRGLQHAYARRCGTVLRRLAPGSNRRPAVRLPLSARSAHQDPGLLPHLLRRHRDQGRARRRDVSSRCVGRIRTV